MCSIEEAWAGQTFEGRSVQSQADLRRKYIAVPDELLERNNEFSIGRNDPTPRNNSRGLNSRLSREPRIPNVQRATADTNMQFSSVMSNESTYGGLEPRPGYMSIYDNADKQNTNVTSNGMMMMPQPSITNGAERFNNNDINNAFMVSNTVDKFMNNPLLNEDSDEDHIMLEKKLNKQNYNNTDNSNNSNNFTNNNVTDITTDFQKSLMEILKRLDRIENQIKHNSQRNMYDIVLYILIGLLIAFIVYLAVSRK